MGRGVIQEPLRNVTRINPRALPQTTLVLLFELALFIDFCVCGGTEFYLQKNKFPQFA